MQLKRMQGQIYADICGNQFYPLATAQVPEHFYQQSQWKNKHSSRIEELFTGNRKNSF